MTPTKAARVPGSDNINTVDVVATQRHFLNLGTPLTGCRLIAADVNGDSSVDTVDVIAIQRFFLGLSTGIANVGKYQFTPVNRTYTGIMSDQTAQNYDTLVFGDAAAGFVELADGPSQTAANDGTSAGEVPATVATVALPEVAVNESKSNFIAAVKTSAIDAKNKLVGFQGDFTFDERVVSFQNQPVQNAGLTSGNWNVSGNVPTWNGTDQDAAHIRLHERLRASVGVGNALRTECDQGEQGSSRHAIDLGATAPLHLHRRRSEAIE